MEPSRMNDSRSSEPLYECNACDWIGPGRETVHPKHDETCWVCPECHETIAPVVGRPSNQKVIDYLDHPPKRHRQMGSAMIEDRNGSWVQFEEMDLYMFEGGQLMQQMAADHTRLQAENEVLKRALAAKIREVPAVETPDGVPVAEFVRYRSCLYRANGRLIQLGQEPEKLDYPDRPAENGKLAT